MSSESRKSGLSNTPSQEINEEPKVALPFITEFGGSISDEEIATAVNNSQVQKEFAFELTAASKMMHACEYISSRMKGGISVGPEESKTLIQCSHDISCALLLMASHFGTTLNELQRLKEYLEEPISQFKRN